MRRGPKQKYHERERILISIERSEREILELAHIPYQRILIRTLKNLVQSEVEKGIVTPARLRELAEAEEVAAQYCETNCEEHRARANIYRDIALKKIPVKPASKAEEVEG
jgi:hypothetical protein